MVDPNRLIALHDGAGVAPSSSPRPFLHPVRTLGGVVLTASRPAGHDWHLGLGFTVADVDGTNFWGGGTYVHGRGYVDRDDHGHQRLDHVETAWTGGTETITEHRTWVAHDGTPLLSEIRTTTCTPLAPVGGLDDRTSVWSETGTGSLSGLARSDRGTRHPGADLANSTGDIRAAVWVLGVRSVLAPVGEGPVRLGSPGSNGRERAGYGGWFWRFPRCAGVEISTPDAVGEDAVLGTRAPWVRWAADFGADGHSGATGPATILLAPGDPVTAADPWFVRVADYPAIGSAVAWDRPVAVEAGTPFVRSLRAVVADGRRTADELLVHLAD